MLAYGKLIAAMADSRLFPKKLSYRLPTNKVPVVAMVAGSLIGIVIYAVCLENPKTMKVWPGIIAIFACLTYCIQLFGYIVVRTKLGRLERRFRSPFGVVGALYSMIIFIICAISLLVLHNSSSYNLVVGVGAFALVTAYYYVFGYKNQVFSVEEQLLLMPAHVENLNANGTSLGKSSSAVADVMLIVVLQNIFTEGIGWSNGSWILFSWFREPAVSDCEIGRPRSDRAPRS
jgi:ethanolamine permease